MEIFLEFFLGFLSFVAIVIFAVIRINRCGAKFDVEFESNTEHESDAMHYPRHEA